jgi:RNA polymerase sigma-70 factor (ECF subfamily)
MGGETQIGAGGASFPETCWTDVLGARDAGALQRLIERYWKPAYFFIRRRGASIEDAKDLTQAFFAAILEREALARVERGHGRFRAWLLACLRNFLSDQSDRARAERRGGGRLPASIDAAESEYARDVPGEGPGPEETFHRKWALDLLRAALETLDPKWRGLLQADGRGEPVDPRRRFDARRALREALLSLIRPTVASEREAEEELRELLRDFA